MIEDRCFNEILVRIITIYRGKANYGTLGKIGEQNAIKN